MKESIFNPEQQQKYISSKIVVGLERISEVFKVLLWEKAKLVGLSPIQIQVLIFIAYHKENLCNVSHLAREFNITKPTVSDVIKVLCIKGLIEKDFSSSDSRSYSLTLTDLGAISVNEIYDFANPLNKQINTFDQTEMEDLFETIGKLIYKLNRSGILSVQRTCYACKFHQRNEEVDYCNLLEKDLLKKDIRLDCQEYENKG